MTKLLLDEVFSTLRAAQRNISDVDLAALPPFPLHNQSILHDLTVVWEKTALLGDLTLRLPDLVRNHAQQQSRTSAATEQQQSRNSTLHGRLRCLPVSFIFRSFLPPRVSLPHAPTNSSPPSLPSLPCSFISSPSPTHPYTYLYTSHNIIYHTTNKYTPTKKPKLKVHAQTDNHNVRMQVAEWAIGVCEPSPMYEGVHGTQLGLVRQELRIADEVDPSYINPFSDANLKKQKVEHLRKQRLEQKTADKLEKKETRGPRLSILRNEF